MSYDDYVDEIIEEVYTPFFSDNNLQGIWKDVFEKVLEEDSQKKLNYMQNIAVGYSKELTGDEKAEFDKELMDAVITAGLVLNENIYCESFLDAYRKR